ncbi:MAG TPA: glycoside hydrolase family 2 TIM barrel-domain containing protein [Hanamia sp.]|nr:glycoside hydrolase family 2 TIM barrel-domain containing protein [Hanamia sp.]
MSCIKVIIFCLVLSVFVSSCTSPSTKPSDDSGIKTDTVAADITYSTGNLITNIPGRNTISLDGSWQYIIDPYETGFYNYRYRALKEDNPAAYWNVDTTVGKSDLKEFGYSNKHTLQVPGDWNHQDSVFLYYEGTVWYKKSFDFQKQNSWDKVFLYFGAVNYRADVYLNGKRLGMHVGGFTPFDFEIPNGLLKERNNYLVVKVDNKRHKDDVPTLNTDWWNYGGITRSVMLVEVPDTFIQDYFLHLKNPKPGEAPSSTNATVNGWIKLNQKPAKEEVLTIEIPELKVKKQLTTTKQLTKIDFELSQVTLWSPAHPKLYRVIIASNKDTTADEIGFRTIQAYNKQVLLNGYPIFMRGICMHEEIPEASRRAYSMKDAKQLLGQAKELGCNMVRLAHYPYDETMTRLADSMGLLVWSEIPVYWTIDFKSRTVLRNAEAQLTDMITRDHNRASVIIWSIGNETPISEARTKFMHNLIDSAHSLDNTRMVTTALQVNFNSDKKIHEVNDPLGQYVDMVAFNEYLGWYGGLPNKCRTANWATPYDKPLFISETGAGAKSGFHADSLTRFSEEYQKWYYEEQLAMLKRMPDNFVGLSPWVLNDFRSPKRNNPKYQNGWNRKGLFDNEGHKKEAFYILKRYYEKMIGLYPDK